MMTEPQGPIYMCYDAALQEAPLAAPSAARSRRGEDAEPHRARSGGARGSGRAHPRGASGRCCCRNIVGRVANGFSDMVALAETLGAPVVDVGSRG